MRRLGLILLAVGFLAPLPAAGQLVWGGHLVRAGQAFDGSSGVGVRVGADLPFLPFDLMLSGERLFPSCPVDARGCGLQGVTVDGNFRMMMPLVRPYLSGGLAYRRFSPGGDAPSANSSGISLGAGVDLSLLRFRVFGEGRYEFVDAPRSQPMVRVGVLVRFP